jgi:hypothetical protein
MILRRLYLYVVSAAGLGLLAAGLALLGTAALALTFNAPYASDPSYRAQLGDLYGDDAGRAAGLGRAFLVRAALRDARPC